VGEGSRSRSSSLCSHPSRKEFYTKMAEKQQKEAPTFDPDDQTPGKKILRNHPEGFDFKYEDPFEMG
jgi:hypothetical protein